MANFVKVTGSGSATLPTTGTDMTKAYSATDPGVLCDIYSGLKSYEIPGPAVWDGASSGPAPAPTTPTTPTTSAAPVSSAAPTKTATPVVIPTPTPIKDDEPAAPSETGSSGNGSTLPETFTIEQFISWLKTTTGSSASRVRRAHARAFQL